MARGCTLEGASDAARRKGPLEAERGKTQGRVGPDLHLVKYGSHMVMLCRKRKEYGRFHRKGSKRVLALSSEYLFYRFVAKGELPCFRIW